jgi:hypothetical protein
MSRRVLLAALVLALAACSGGGSGHSSTATTAAATPTSSPAQVCTGQLRHWATVLLDTKDQSGLDYQEMALGGTQYVAVLDIARRAKKLRAQAGRAAAVAFVDREAARSCAAMTATPCTTSADTGWPC